MKPISFHPEAALEFSAQVDRYDQTVVSLGTQFATSVERAVELASRLPAGGTPHLYGTRRLRARNFPFSIVYLDRGTDLVILAVAHHRREPGYWRSRSDER